MRVYTIGYQGLSIDLYVRSLVNAGVGVVLDVREHAWSQRAEFIKSNLERSLLNAGIEYRHLKSAGNPASNRKTARSATECMRRYRKYLLDNPEGLNEVLSALRYYGQNSRLPCFTCYERSHEDCHRSVLMAELLKCEPDLAPIHLEPSLNNKKRSNQYKQRAPLADAFLSPLFLPFT